MKKNNEKMHWARALQKDVMIATERVANAASQVADTAMIRLQEVDQSAGVSAMLKEAGDKIREQSASMDESYGISEKANHVLAYSKDVASKISDASMEMLESSGAIDITENALKKARETVINPTMTAIRKSGIDQAVEKAMNHIEHGYGRTREVIKPYFAAEDTQELLKKTRQELAKVSACIMQISNSDSEKLASQFGGALLAKVSGAAAVGTLLGLVAAFGSAGTGTAIASLSGAAASSATLGWIGGLVGGGMSAGAALTGGVSLIVGLATYKLLGSDRRPFESLSEAEQRIVQTCWLTIAIVDEYLAAGATSRAESITDSEADQLLVNIFRPLLESLKQNQADICKSLDGKHAVAFRQHVITDFKHVVIDGFEHLTFGYPLKDFSSAASIIGGVFYALLTNSAVGNDDKSQLVMDAIYRAKPSLSGQSEAEIGDYFRSLTPGELKGLASNIKGIYHEKLYVYNYNSINTETQAVIFSDPYHPGSDIQIIKIESGEVIEDFQLKAVLDLGKIKKHFDRYPEINVLATNEVAEKIDDPRVESSGFNNEDLKTKVNETITDVADNTVVHRASDSAIFAVGIHSTKELLEMLKGEKEFPEAIVSILKSAGVAGTSTMLAALLLG